MSTEHEPTSDETFFKLQGTQVAGFSTITATAIDNHVRAVVREMLAEYDRVPQVAVPYNPDIPIRISHPRMGLQETSASIRARLKAACEAEGLRAVGSRYFEDLELVAKAQLLNLYPGQPYVDAAKRLRDIWREDP